MRKAFKVIGYVLEITLLIMGGYILLFSDFVEPLKYKYPLGLSSCLIALILAWILSNNKKKKSSWLVFIYMVVLIAIWIILSIKF